MMESPTLSSLTALEILATSLVTRSLTPKKFWWGPKRQPPLDDVFEGSMDFVSIDIDR
jgi:hypothetical protein